LNNEAVRHLTLARGFLDKGESFYHKAAEEIVAAQQADPSLTNVEIGEWFGRGRDWVRTLVTWHTSGDRDRAPFAGKSEVKDTSKTRVLLREAPMEQVERILDELPPERVQQIAAAAGHSYHRARVEYDESERNMTPAQRSQREAEVDEMLKPVRQATAGFATLGIIGHLEQAHEEIHELVADGSLTKKLVRQIDRALQTIEAEMQVARGLVGIEEE